MLTDPARTTAAAPGAPPRLADGTELLGRYEGSGFKDPPWIARRGDGQTVQLTRLLHLVAEKADGSRDEAALADAVSAEYDKRVSPDQAGQLVDRLRKLGILTLPDGSSPKVEKPDPLLALRYRVALVNPRVVRAITGIFKPLFFPPVVVAVVAGVVALDVWLFGVHGIGQGLRESLYQPALLLMVFALVIVGAAFHEFGHAVGCRYSGATPGAMGAGLYLAWPAFYTDVTDAYRLGRGGRLRTDLGGVYFNLVVILATAGAYFATGFEPLLVVIAVQHLEIVHQLLPFVRLDGYYIVADLTGVPDLFSRLRPILASLVPFRKADKRVTELKWWARAVATVWVLAVVPLLLFNLAILAVTFPRILATAWDSANRVVDGMQGALGVAAGVVQLLALSLPILGIVLMFLRLGRRLALATWRKTDGHPVMRTGGAAVTVAAAALLAYVWLPDGDYAPIREDERGTLVEYVSAVEDVSRGGTGVVARDGAEPRADTEDPAQPGPQPTGDPAVVPVAPDPTSSPVQSSDPEPTPSASASPSDSPSATESPSPSSSP